MPAAWVRPARLSLLRCRVGAKAGVPAPPAQTRPVSRLPPAWHRPCPLPRCQPPRAAVTRRGAASAVMGPVPRLSRSGWWRRRGRDQRLPLHLYLLGGRGGITALAPYVTLPAQPCAPLLLPKSICSYRCGGKRGDRCCPRSAGLNSQQQSRLGYYAGASEGEARCPEPVPARGRGTAVIPSLGSHRAPRPGPRGSWVLAGAGWRGDGVPTCHQSCLQAGLQLQDERSGNGSGGTGAAAGFAPPRRVPSVPHACWCDAWRATLGCPVPDPSRVSPVLLSPHSHHRLWSLPVAAGSCAGSAPGAAGASGERWVCSAMVYRSASHAGPPRVLPQGWGSAQGG